MSALVPIAAAGAGCFVIGALAGWVWRMRSLAASVIRGKAGYITVKCGKCGTTETWMVRP